ncbi:MAG TPA: CDP-alcohol phosphatidyltransferase family protein [Polyangium sp.]|nr:CDP-alcohol phosphatidyltransferase family protein [Polyangium sp.]
MPQLRLADLALLPNVLSALRLPLAVAFPFVVANPRAAVGVLVAAALTDVFDGWLARRWDQATAMGAIVDPIADKVFASTVVVTLLVHHDLPRWALPALLAREILEAPLVLWLLVSHPFRRLRRTDARANVPGKLATVVQFVAVIMAIVAPHWLFPALVAAAVSGVLAGFSYWRRELRRLPKTQGS